MMFILIVTDYVTNIVRPISWLTIDFEMELIPILFKNQDFVRKTFFCLLHFWLNTKISSQLNTKYKIQLKSVSLKEHIQVKMDVWKDSRNITRRDRCAENILRAELTSAKVFTKTWTIRDFLDHIPNEYLWIICDVWLER